MKWNNEQLQAIHTTGVNILVSASAGAGKTSLLVERLLTLCTREENHIDLNRIVAMTFTDAAASEMKKRLSIALNNKLKNCTGDKSQIEKQLIYLNTAQISTIHSFCLSIIKKYYDVINLNPAMIENNLDESTINDIKEQAFYNSLYAYKKENNLDDVINFFFNGVFNLNDLKEAILSIVDCANSTFDKELWYKNVLNSYKPINKIHEIDDKILCLFFDSIKLNLFSIKELFDYTLNIYENIKDELDKNFESTFKLIEYYLGLINENIKDRNLNDIKINSEKLKNIKIAVSSKFPENFQNVLKELKKRIKDFDLQYYEENDYVLSHNNVSIIVKKLIDIARLTSDEIKKIKEEINGFDFDDMEHFAYDILKSNNQMVANILKNEFDEILIDEFQDTNEIQNEIINLIAKENNVFRVGDVKQSIYRFRKAKPSIMRNMMLDKNFKVISLKNNYRSKENIVNFTNYLFNKIMNIDGFNDTYKDIDNVSIGTDAQKLYNPNTIGFYALIENESDDSELKADFISSKINQLVNEKGYNYKDFVILVKGHSPKKVIKKSFEKFNIPYFIDSKTGFYNSWMSLILTNFLKLTLNTNDDISLMSVLTSPIYSQSDEDIAKLLLEHKNLYTACLKTNHPIISDLKVLKNINIIHEKLNYIALINNFINEKCDNQQRSNFDLYFENVLNFEKRSINLNKFIEQIEHAKNDSSSEAISVGSDENVVRVMTIHHSKGLQFKVVFLWGNGKSPTVFDKVMCDSNLGIALDNINTNYYLKEKTIHKIAFEFNENLEETQEFIRLLYVALTRAQEEMYIVDCVKKQISQKTINSFSAIKNNGVITNTILNNLSESELFNITYIEDFKPEIHENKVITNSSDKLPRYEYGLQDKINIVSPSKDSHEISLELDLNRNPDTFSRGLLMHKAIEDLPNKIWTEDDLKQIDYLKKSDIQHIINFNNSNIYKQCLTMTIYHEFPFIYKENTNIINGIIDFIAFDESKIIIIDFKSDRNITEQILIDNYSKQLKFYEETISKNYPNHKVYTYIYSFELDKEIQIK